MRLLIYTFLILLFTLVVKGQNWNQSASCNINSQDGASNYARVHRTPPREATVKIRFTDINCNCSGTIVNRNTSDNDVKFYLLTARHCLFGQSEDPCPSVNLDGEHELYFNYQSPDGNTFNTVSTNHGINAWQSGEFNPNTNTTESQGYEYLHRSRLRLVNDFTWGDFALLEIITPVPPHFNISHAGWNPSLFHNGVQVGTMPQNFDPYIGIHHPKGDIKKLSTIQYIHWNENPIATNCYTITVIIDVLFGWIWGHTISTQVICNWMDNPWLSVFAWNQGITQPGSSGSGLFNKNNRQIGILSFGPENFCNLGNMDQYGKFRSNYFKQSIKNTLNPSNDPNVDYVGLGSRKITCYDNLDLPGAAGVSGHYFPANHYQPENTILLQSKNNITTNAAIRVYGGADYRFKAANVIDIDDYFEAEQGSYVEMEIGNCGGAGKEPSTESILAQRLKEYNLPKEKKLDMQRFGNGQLFASADKQSYLQIFPNPTAGVSKLRFSEPGNYQVVVKDFTGRQVAFQQANQVKEMPLQIDVVPGQYFVNVSDEKGRMQFGKLSIVK